MEIKKLTILLYFFIQSYQFFAQDSIVFPVFFDYRQSTLDSFEERSLRLLLSNLKNYTLSGVNIVAYCDDRGKQRLNDTLSQRRAVSVRDLVLSFNYLDSGKISSLGLGSLPTDMKDDVDAQRRKNRRAEIRIVYAKKILAPSKPSIPNAASTAKLNEDTINKKVLNDFFTQANKGEKLALRLIFEGGTIQLMRYCYSEMDELVRQMKSSTRKIQIQGHVCCLSAHEDDGLNMHTGTRDLSLGRARMVYSYLIHHGIDKDRLSYVGFGGKFPKHQGSVYDRRVEIEMME